MKTWIALWFGFLFIPWAFSNPGIEFEAGKRFIGTSGFILFNLIPDLDNPPSFFQLNAGYWLTKSDVVSVEAITWKYNAPLGIQYGSSFGDPDKSYPGTIQDFGLGISYQRFLWKGIYTAMHALPLLQKYEDIKGNKLGNGFMLFLTTRLGYHFELFNDRIFFEPSVASTYWPIKTNTPQSFLAEEKKWPNYFLFEPGLHCGFKF